MRPQVDDALVAARLVGPLADLDLRLAERVLRLVLRAGRVVRGRVLPQPLAEERARTPRG